jgi:FkbM family methyltransferase
MVARVRLRLRTVGFNAARTLLYRTLIPLSVHSGPLEPLALSVFRLLSDRPLAMRDLPCPIHLDGLTLWYDAARPSNTIRALAAGTYEQPIADLFASVLRPGMAVLDVGAHIGYFSVVAGKRVGPTGQIWSFEPDPANRASLERNVAANGMDDRISVVPLAVASAAGERILYRVAGDTGSSTVYPRGETGGDSLAVTTTSLDVWAASEGWPPVDLVKVDAEGAEADVLAGMTEVIRRNPTLVTVLEFQADALEAAGEDPLNFLRRLVGMSEGHVELLDDRGHGVLDRDNVLRKLVRRSRWSPLNLAIWSVTAPGNRDFRDDR